MKTLLLSAVCIFGCSYTSAFSAELNVRAPTGATVSIMGLPDSKCKQVGVNRFCGGHPKLFGSKKAVGGTAHFSLSIANLSKICATVNGKGKCIDVSNKMNVVVK